MGTLFTDQVTYDNLSLHAVTVPTTCRRMMLREVATDAAPTPFDLAAPSNTNQTFRLAPLESITFDAGEGRFFNAGGIVGYIQPVNGTVTFTRICYEE